MLLSNVVLLADIALQGSEDIALVQKEFATSTLDFKQLLVSNTTAIGSSLAILRGDREVF